MLHHFKFGPLKQITYRHLMDFTADYQAVCTIGQQRPAKSLFRRLLV